MRHTTSVVEKLRKALLNRILNDETVDNNSTWLSKVMDTGVCIKFGPRIARKVDATQSNQSLRSEHRGEERTR